LNARQARIGSLTPEVELDQRDTGLHNSLAEPGSRHRFSTYASAGLSGRIGGQPGDLPGALDDCDKRIGCSM